MTNFCQKNAEVDSITYLLSLNDSFLQWNLNKFYNRSTYISVNESRNGLEELLSMKEMGEKLLNCQISNFLWLIIPPILLFFGTLGNVLAFFVLCQKSLLRTSSYVYLLVITVIDETILLTGLLRRWIDYLVGYRMENISFLSCKISQFIGVTVSHASVWLIVLMTIERLFVIKMPLHASRFINPYKTKIYITILFLVLASIASHFFETVSLVNPNLVNISRVSIDKDQEDNTILECQFKPKYSHLVSIWMIIDGLFYSIIPFVLLIIMNGIIIKKTYEASKNRATMLQHSQIIKTYYSSRCSRFHTKLTFSHFSYETKQLTIMLLAISFAFLCTTTPLVTLKFVLQLKKMKDDLKNRDTLQLMDTIFELLMYVNHSINFLLYCATGKRFRIQLMKIIKRESRSNNNSNLTSKIQSTANLKKLKQVSYSLTKLKDHYEFVDKM